LEGLSQEELSVADPADSPHAANALNLTQRELWELLRVLIGKHSKLVRAFFACSVPAELTTVLFLLFELFAADVAVLLVREIFLHWPFKGENWVIYLEANFLVPSHVNLVGVAHEIFLDFSLVTVLRVDERNKLTARALSCPSALVK